MLFSGKVKNEIYRNKAFRARARQAFAAGLLAGGGRLDGQQLLLVTENEEVCRLAHGLVLDLCGQPPVVQEVRQRGVPVYQVQLMGDAACGALLARLELPQEGLPAPSQFEAPAQAAAFLSGAFLGCGSVADPEKGYHLELLPPREGMADWLFMRLSALGYPPKSTLRRGAPVLYYKESEQIEDLLTMMGASNCSLELMEVKIVKEIRNNANRVTNCETANIDKTVGAAARQLQAIQRLEKAVGLQNLPPDLREIALLRLEHPEYSLRELAAAAQPPLSRSGLNHRLRRLEEMAQGLSQ